MPRAFSIGQAGGEQVSSIVFPSATAVFLATLQTHPGAPWEPIEFLTRLAQQQIALAGGPNLDTEIQAIPAELARYLPHGADMGDEFILVQEFAGLEDLGDDLQADPRLVTFLNDNTLSGVQLWTSPQLDTIVAISITRYPYERFGGVALGAVIGAETREVELVGVSDQIANAVAFEGVGTRAGEIGASFRRGRYLVIVLANGEPAPARRATALFSQRMAELAPSGPSGAQTFPSSAKSIALSAVLVIGFGVALIAIRVLRTRRFVRPTAVTPPGAGTVLDASQDAHRLRRSAIGLTSVQLATWAIAIVGFAADTSLGVRIVIVGFAVAAGFVITGWWRRRELSRIGAAAPPWRPELPQLQGLILNIAGIGCFLLGMAAIIWGLRELVFVPSLTHLQWCDTLRTSPTLLAWLIAGGGLVLIVGATALLRLARATGRRDAERTRRTDPRPPVLYLRSFDDDDVALPCVLSARRPFLELFTFRATDPFEESLAWELATYGPVTAVGRPGAHSQRLGAAREYFSNDTWKPQVVERMANAGVIAVIIGKTPGLEWEIDTIARHGHLDKTIFLVPPGTADDQRRRWDITCAALPENRRPELDLTSVLSFQIIDGQGCSTVVDRRDEAAYRVAVDYTLSERAALT